MPEIEAPYVETDKRMLGDSHLNPEEAVFREREKCLKEASKYRIANQDELADAKRSEGSRLSFSAVLAKLQKIVPGLVARDGSPGNLALYYPKTAKQLDEALREGGTSDEFFIFNRYVGGFPKEELPEWGYVDIDTSLIATREHLRGWRTVLIGLMNAGILSYADATREFGDPAMDKRNTVWMTKTLEWRENPRQKFTLQDYLERKK
jgi:hypothetical protein